MTSPAEQRPHRVQLSRKKGWRMPENTVKVSRPGPWGNPFNFKHSSHCWTALAYGERGDPAGRHAASVKAYRQWLEAGDPVHSEAGLYVDIDGAAVTIAAAPEVEAPAPPTKDRIRQELRGKHLGCWCRLDQACHADILLEIANAD